MGLITLSDVYDAIQAQHLDMREYNERILAPVRYLSASIKRPADTTAYTANDAFADSAATVGGFTFLDTAHPRAPAAASQLNTGGFIITDGIFVASAATAYTGEVWLYDTAVTAVADNAAFTNTDAEALNLIGVIPFSTADIAAAANAISYVTQIDVRFNCLPSDLRFLVKIMNAPTPASAEILSIKLKYMPMRPF